MPISRVFQGLFETLVFFAVGGLVWGEYTLRAADPNVPDGQAGLFLLAAVVFMLGGVWGIAATMGLVPPPSAALRRAYR